MDEEHNGDACKNRQNIAWDGDEKEARVMAGGEVKKWKAKRSSTPL